MKILARSDPVDLSLFVNLYRHLFIIVGAGVGARNVVVVAVVVVTVVVVAVIVVTYDALMSIHKNFFSLSLTERPKTLQHLYLISFSSWPNF
jgi:hypothetical protein